ncbi:MAG: PAS domain S-box protein, partial [bacterium]
MKKTSHKSKTLASLRKRAEEKLRQQTGRLEEISTKDIESLIQELGTYQIELEIQNEELRRSQEELEASRRKYVDLYDFAPVGYFTFDEKGLIREVNLTGSQMLGFNKRLLLNKPFYPFIKKDDMTVFRAHHTEVMEKGVLHTCEIRLLRKGGQLFYAQLRSVRAEDMSGDEIHCRTAVIDVTEQRKAEERTEHLASFPQLNPNPIIEVDSSGRVLFANPATRKILKSAGLPDGDVHVFLPEDMDIILRDLGRKKEAVIYRQVIVKDRVFGETVHLSPHFNVVRIYAYDITARKRAEEALQESEAKFRLISETSIDVIFQTDSEGLITYCSPSGEKYGYSIEEVTGRSFGDFLSPHELPKAKDAFQKTMTGERIERLELRMLRKDGTPIHAELNVAPLLKKGKIIGIQGIARDITERKRAEDALHRVKEELELRVMERTLDLVRANEELEEEIAERKRAEERLRENELLLHSALESLRDSGDQLRNLSVHLQAAREEERTTIAREIHDELGQVLTALKMDLSWVSGQYKDHKTLFEKSKTMLAIVDSTIQAVKRIVTELRPGVLDHLGLGAAIEWQ